MLINALKLEVHSLAPLGLLIEDVKVLSHNFDKLFYSHTKKNGNSVAHSLAKYDKRISDFQLWMEDISPYLFGWFALINFQRYTNKKKKNKQTK